MRFVSKVLFTLKTHKDPPTCRVIHSSAGHPAAALSHVWRKKLQQWLRPSTHIYNNTVDMLKTVCKIYYPKDIIVWTYVINGFYMEGRPR